MKSVAEMTRLELLGCRFRVWPVPLRLTLRGFLISYYDDEWMAERVSEDVIRLKNLTTGHGVNVSLSDVRDVQWQVSYNPNDLRRGTLQLRKRVWLRGNRAGVIPFRPIRNLRIAARPAW